MGIPPFEMLPGQLDRVVALLRNEADATDRHELWPATQLLECAATGMLGWFAPQGRDVTPADQTAILRALTRLASGCLTTAFCLTQPAGVIARIFASDNERLKHELLPDLIAGRTFGSVGIAQLTTSRRHVQPPLKATELADGTYRLDGVIPWVTGGAYADWIITGAVLDDGRQLLGVLPTKLPGVTVDPPAEMVGLTATATGPVRCDGVVLEPKWLLAPVVADVLKHGKGAGTGGLQTSALALGTALAAIEFLAGEAERRSDLEPIVAELRDQWTAIDYDLIAALSNPTNNDDVRHRANGLALRSSQAALAAAKGSGYVVGHPAGRWCREALFFLVWSCPQPVVNATLCELAKL
jgi:alkylation response protein AidB-like acyl-CoA dehydrogenase